jgi:hypothetical protein
LDERNDLLGDVEHLVKLAGRRGQRGFKFQHIASETAELRRQSRRL